MKTRGGRPASPGARIFLLLVAAAALGTVAFGIYAVSHTPPATERGASSLPPQRAQGAGASPAPAPARPPG